MEFNFSIHHNPKYLVSDSKNINNIGYAKTQEYHDISDMINMSVEKFSTYDYYAVDRLSPKYASSFYSNRIKSLEKWLKTDEVKNKYNKQEKEYLIHSAKTLKTPFYYSYMDGWNELLEYLSSIFYIFALVMCILLAPAFGVEYQTGSDSIFLSSRYGKNKGIIMKIAASFTIVTVLYWLVVLLFTGIILFFYGGDGGNCPIQANSWGWKSMYHLTNVEAYFWMVGLAYIGCLGLAAITLWFSTKLKSSFGTVILAFLLILGPSLITDSFGLEIKILYFFPHGLLNGHLLMMLYELYTIGGKVYTPYNVFPVIYITAMVLLLPLTYRAFQKHQPQ